MSTLHSAAHMETLLRETLYWIVPLLQAVLAAAQIVLFLSVALDAEQPLHAGFTVAGYNGLICGVMTCFYWTPFFGPILFGPLGNGVAAAQIAMHPDDRLVLAGAGAVIGLLSALEHVIYWALGWRPRAAALRARWTGDFEGVDQTLLLEEP